MREKIMVIITASLGIFLMITAEASDYHKKHVTEINIEPTPVIIDQVTQPKTEMRGVALSSASGQHHYKATNQLQWSLGASFVGENDDSAVSFGLGKQTGKVFVSGNYGSDGSNSIIGVSASGTF